MFNPCCHLTPDTFLCLFRIEKFEKERLLNIHCRKNGWTDISGELEEYEKVLEEEKKVESRSFFPSQYNNNTTNNIKHESKYRK